MTTAEAQISKKPTTKNSNDKSHIWVPKTYTRMELKSIHRAKADDLEKNPKTNQINRGKTNLAIPWKNRYILKNLSKAQKTSCLKINFSELRTTS